ncbi:B12-binding domain-containing radical SAM protein [Bacillus pseudomycoides]|uniref:B12-binding domain-containing radical SAM protein n=1 Tax=Bacillus pseudomycoides TaxID=64104 RepID=UPI000BFDC953|nr:radical SAM protein [Bacillus pseudomycoides]MED1625117.1 radical SAM protein [Bacillus pseudomycoides]PHC41193.1 radical SAM protein [Bacillus pseudomycoides]
MKICLFNIKAKDFSLPPYGIWVLKSYLDFYSEANGLNIDVKCLTFEHNTPYKDIYHELVSERPDLIGVSHYIWNDSSTMNILNKLKTDIFYPVNIIVGGPHVSVADKRLVSLLEQQKIDAMIIGEGEIPLLHIVNCLHSQEDISPIPGILCESNIREGYVPQFFKTNENINYLPNPYLNEKELLNESVNVGVIQYETSRGCPFTCTFCDQGHKPYRSLTIERIKEDLTYFSTKGIKHISFLDSTFNLSPKRTVEILKNLIHLNKEWTFHAEIKPENLTSTEIDLMAQANCYSVELGLQSVNEPTLKFIKRRNNWKRIEDNVTQLLNKNINVIVNTIIGLPGEGIKEWFATLDYCFNLGRIKIYSNILKILPNTDMFEQIEEFEFNFNVEKFNAIESTKTFTKEQIKKAITINKLVNLFWNDVNTPNSIVEIVQKGYEGKFHRFLESLYFYLINNPNLLNENFRVNTLKKIIEDKKLEEELVYKVNNDFEVRVGI